MNNESEVEVTATETSDKVEPTAVENKVGETSVEETNDDSKESLIVETPEAKRARLKRQLERLDEKYGFKDKEKEKPTPKAKKTVETDELDWGQKAYLKSSGIEPSEFDFVKEQIAESGKDIDSLLQNKYFQEELKSYREQKAVLRATPGSTRNAAEPASTKVDYWIAKGELPKDPELRAKVVDRKYELSKQGVKF